MNIARAETSCSLSCTCERDISTILLSSYNCKCEIFVVIYLLQYNIPDLCHCAICVGCHAPVQGLESALNWLHIHLNMWGIIQQLLQETHTHLCPISWIKLQSWSEILLVEYQNPFQARQVVWQTIPEEDLEKLGVSGEPNLAVGTDKAVGGAHSLDQLDENWMKKSNLSNHSLT